VTIAFAGDLPAYKMKFLMEQLEMDEFPTVMKEVMEVCLAFPITCSSIVIALTPCVLSFPRKFPQKNPISGEKD
tara:strand:- start:28 stop:249 length:222 start_codon:yes stop_codon:yes gene_type:complete